MSHNSVWEQPCLQPRLNTFSNDCYKHFNVGYWTLGTKKYCLHILHKILTKEQFERTKESSVIISRCDEGNKYEDILRSQTFEVKKLDNHFTNSPLGQYFVRAEFHKNKDMSKNLAQYSDGDYSVSRWISGDSSSRTLVLLSCDGVYFRNYFSSIYGALVEHGKHIVLWVHLINPSDADIYEIKRMRRQLKLNDKNVGIYYSKTFKRFAASVDQQKAMLSYCSLARLLVMSRLLSLTKMDILSLDADTMVLRDFSALSQTMHICRCDLALRLGFCKKDRKSRFSMATIFVRWSNNSQLFTRELTKKIHEVLNSSNHINMKDHEITMEVYNGLRQKVRLYKLPLAYADHTYRSTTIIWDGAMI